MKIKMMFVTAMLMLFISCTFDNNQGSSPKTETTDVTSFTGKIMTSSDQGKTWQGMQQQLPDHITIQAVGFDNDNIIIAVNKDTIYTVNKNMNEAWKQQSVDELTIHKSINRNTMVGSIWSCGNNQYLEVVFGDLYKKNLKTAQWIPVNKPKNVNGISQITEDEKGNVLLASQYGLFFSQDGCTTWTQILSGRVDDVEMLKDEIFVSSLRGILSSKDLGNNWTSHKTPVSGFGFNDPASFPFYNLSVQEGELMAIKSQGNPNDNRDAKILSFSSPDRVWSIHDANKYLKNMPNLTGFTKFGNSLYCSFGEGLMVSEDNGISWKQILKYSFTSLNKALKVVVVDGVLYCYEISAGC